MNEWTEAHFFYIKIRIKIVSMCLAELNSDVCMLGFAWLLHGFPPDIPEYTWTTSSLEAAVGDARGTGETASAFFSCWCARLDRSFWDRGQRFLRKYERATSCNQAVSVTTRVQRNSELPLKMPPDHSSEVEWWWAVGVCEWVSMCMCVSVCVLRPLREETEQANSC